MLQVVVGDRQARNTSPRVQFTDTTHDRSLQVVPVIMIRNSKSQPLYDLWTTNPTISRTML
ncbi:hypothetical protein HAX54_008448, partial [Datura stramonium]|nr:hypothetical protein [Datura stramonium]